APRESLECAAALIGSRQHYLLPIQVVGHLLGQRGRLVYARRRRARLALRPGDAVPRPGVLKSRAAAEEDSIAAGDIDGQPAERAAGWRLRWLGLSPALAVPGPGLIGSGAAAEEKHHVAHRVECCWRAGPGRWALRGRKARPGGAVPSPRVTDVPAVGASPIEQYGAHLRLVNQDCAIARRRAGGGMQVGPPAALTHPRVVHQRGVV